MMRRTIELKMTEKEVQNELGLDDQTRVESAGAAHQHPHYKTVLDSLKRRREELDIAIATVSQLTSSSSPGDREPISRDEGKPKRQNRLSQAILEVLDEFGRPARNAEIKRELLARGYGADYVSFDVSLIQALKRLDASAAVVKTERGVWSRRT